MFRSPFSVIAIFAPLLFFSNYVYAPSSPNLEIINLGVIFEQGTEEVQSAFKYAVLNYNQNTTSRKLELLAFVDIINTADPFKLSRIICGHINRGIHAFVGAVSADSFATIHSYINTFQVPFITPWFPEKVPIPSSGLTDYAISIRPEFHKAIIDTVVYYGWQNVVYIYDSQDGLLRLQNIYQNMVPGSHPFKISSVRKISNSSDAINFLIGIENVDRWGSKFIILDTPMNLSKEIIVSHARSVFLGKRTYHYLLTGLVLDERWETNVPEFSAINITGFTMVDQSRPFVKYFIDRWSRLDISILNHPPKQTVMTRAALMHDATLILIEGFTRLLRRKPEIFRSAKRGSTGTGLGTANGNGIDCTSSKGLVSPWEHGEKIARFMRRSEIDGLTGHVKFDDQGRRKNFTLYIMEMNLNNNMVKVGEWGDKTGFRVIRSRYDKLPMQHISQNRTYVVSTVIEEPFMMIKKPKSGEILIGNNRFEGYCKDLLDLMAKQLGIKYELHLVKDGKYGEENPNVKGSWNGMIGEVMRKEVDMAVAPLTITAERNRVIDFSTPFMTVGIAILAKKPTKESPSLFSFLDPFTEEVWICISFAFIAVSIVLFIVSRFSPIDWHITSATPNQSQQLTCDNTPQHYSSGLNSCASTPPPPVPSPPPPPPPPGFVTNEFSMFNCFWFSIGTLLQQGSYISPRSLSGRIVCSVWWLFALFLISSYTANQAAFFIVDRMSFPINSVEELAAQTEIEYGTIGHGPTCEFFKKSRIPLYSKMWDFMNMRHNTFVHNVQEGIQKVRISKGKYMLLMESPKLDYINQKQPCDTVKVGRTLDTNGYSVAFPLGSPLKDNVNHIIQRLLANGDLPKLESRWWIDRSECNNSDQQDDNKRNALTLTQVAGIFYILIAGLIFSMIIGLLEFCYKYKMQRGKNKATTIHEAMQSKSRILAERRKFENGRMPVDNETEFISMKRLHIPS